MNISEFDTEHSFEAADAWVCTNPHLLKRLHTMLKENLERPGTYNTFDLLKPFELIELVGVSAQDVATKET